MAAFTCEEKIRGAPPRPFYEGRAFGRTRVNPYLAGSHRLAGYEELWVNVVQVPFERLAAQLLP